MFKYIAGILNGLNCNTVTVGGDMDHIHALFCMNRTKTISDVVRDVKSCSSLWYKKEIGCNFEWQQGYGVFSVGQTNLEVARNYINNQEEHHKRRTFQEEYRWFLDNYKITYDDKYIWE